MRFLGAAIWTLAFGVLAACAAPAPPAARALAARHGAMGIDAFGHTQLAPDCATLPPRARAHARTRSV
jgi:hypothetical protein